MSRSFTLLAYGGPILGFVAGFAVFTAVVLSHPSSGLSTSRLVVACTALLLGPVVIGLPVSLLAQRRRTARR
jgi:hypothetical protein